jgi:N-acyl-L-homoserine lactone synthetase
MLECHIDHGIQDVVVFTDAVWMQSLRQHGVSILGDVPVL